MALVIADRVRETTSSTGTGAITLTGAFLGFQPFSVIGNGNTTYYAIIDAAAGAWEVGVGTYTSSGNTLSRDTVLSSSNADALVVFASGLKDVICTQPAERAVLLDSATNATIPGITLSGGTANGVVYANGSKVLTTGSALTFDAGSLVGTGKFQSQVMRIKDAAYSEVYFSTADTGGNGAISYNHSVNAMAFYANGSEQMRLTSTGLGIGASSEPFARGYGRWLGLSSASTAGFELNAATGNSAFFDMGVNGARTFNINTDASSATIQTANTNPLIFGVNFTEQMRLTSTGLGIGTSSPTQKLHVSGGNIRVSSASESTIITNGGNFTTGALTDSAVIYSGSMLFGNGITERMRLDSSGNLGLGVTPSAWFSNRKAIQINNAGSSIAGFSGGGLTEIRNNSFLNAEGSEIYASTNPAAVYQMNNGTHSWFTAPSGTAGNAISFTQAMTLTAASTLGISVASPKNAYSAFAKIEVGDVGGSLLAGTSSYSGDQYAWLSNNMYADSSGTLKAYRTKGVATYKLLNAEHQWLIAGGTADTAISFTQAMTLDASGNLGVGTTSPSARLDVYQATQSNSTFRAYGPAGQILWANGGSSTSYLDSDTTIFRQSSASGNAERARIDSSGNLLVGTTSVPYSLTNGRISAGNTGAGFYAATFYTITTDTSVLVGFGNPNGLVGSIQTSAVATIYGTSSDYRLKENIQPMTGALAKVAALKPVTYTWKVDGSAGEGFIAHELAEVCPAAVTGEKDAVDANGNPQYQGIDVSFLVGTLTAAIQELKAEFDAYKASHP